MPRPAAQPEYRRGQPGRSPGPAETRRTSGRALRAGRASLRNARVTDQHLEQVHASSPLEPDAPSALLVDDPTLIDPELDPVASSGKLRHRDQGALHSRDLEAQ